ncbi:MAG TPA: hypothetical protein VEJ87_12680, partial [Acidimicrobiales bacterium]|nr:hypothetical protein [Acidimicrobiales bacterium]
GVNRPLPLGAVGFPPDEIRAIGRSPGHDLLEFTSAESAGRRRPRLWIATIASRDELGGEDSNPQ